MRLIKIILTILVLIMILVFCFGSIIPTIIKSTSEFNVRPEVNIWKIIFSLIQLGIGGYLIIRGIKYISKKTKANKALSK